MSKGSEAVKKWRKVTKARLVLALGGKCNCCGYSRSNEALEFHHIDADQKDFALSSIRANGISWEKIITEIRKCALVCSNCHKEIHAGIIKISNNYNKFNEEFAYYKDLEKFKETNLCPICGKLKPIGQLTCSTICGSKRKIPKKFDRVLLESLCKTLTNAEIADYLNISKESAKRRLKKENLIPIKRYSLHPIRIKNRIIKRPLFKILLEDIEKLGFSGTGRKYRVSDNTIRKWIKVYNKCADAIDYFDPCI